MILGLLEKLGRPGGPKTFLEGFVVGFEDVVNERIPVEPPDMLRRIDEEIAQFHEHIHDAITRLRAKIAARLEEQEPK